MPIFVPHSAVRASRAATELRVLMPARLLSLPAISLAVRSSAIGTVVLVTAIAGLAGIMVRDVDEEMRHQAAAALDGNLRLLKQTLVDEGGSSTFAVRDGTLTIGSHVVGAAEPAVDRVRAVMGGTATVFLGDMRVATTVTNPDGSRAVGTRLAPGPSTRRCSAGARASAGRPRSSASLISPSTSRSATPTGGSSGSSMPA